MVIYCFKDDLYFSPFNYGTLEMHDHVCVTNFFLNFNLAKNSSTRY